MVLMSSMMLVLTEVKLYSQIPFPLLQMTPLIPQKTVSFWLPKRTFRVTCILLPLGLLSYNYCAIYRAG